MILVIIFLNFLVLTINLPDAYPNSFFNQIITNNIFDHIKDEIIKYVIQNDKDNFNLTTKELKILFALNIAMTNIKCLNVRMYWSYLLGMRMDLITLNV